MKELNKVARINFVDGCEKQTSLAGNIFLLLLFVPRWVGRRNVVYGRQIGLIWTRNIYVSEIPCLVWRSKRDLGLFGSRDRYNVLFLDKFSQIAKLRRRSLHDICSFSLMRRCFITAVDQGCSRCILFALGLHSVKVSLQIFLSDLFELCKIYIDALGLFQHRPELVGSESEIVIRRLFLFAKPGVKIS